MSSSTGRMKASSAAAAPRRVCRQTVSALLMDNPSMTSSPGAAAEQVQGNQDHDAGAGRESPLAGTPLFENQPGRPPSISQPVQQRRPEPVRGRDHSDAHDGHQQTDQQPGPLPQSVAPGPAPQPLARF